MRMHQRSRADSRVRLGGPSHSGWAPCCSFGSGVGGRSSWKPGTVSPLAVVWGGDNGAGPRRVHGSGARLRSAGAMRVRSGVFSLRGKLATAAEGLDPHTFGFGDGAARDHATPRRAPVVSAAV